MKVIDRLDAYIKTKGLNDRRVCLDCNLANGTLHQARVRNTDLGKKSMEKILSTYSDLNRVWLLTGEGTMLNTDKSSGDNIVINRVHHNSGNYLCEGNVYQSKGNESDEIKHLQDTIEQLRQDLAREIEHSKFLQSVIDKLIENGKK